MTIGAGAPGGESAPRGRLTLLEFILVLAFLGGVAWVVLSRVRLVTAMIPANESSAIASLKSLVAAEERYKTTAGSAVYGTLSQLSAGERPYLDLHLGRGRKGGYSFVMTVGTPADSNYAVDARPVRPGITGRRYFFADSSGVIRGEVGHPARSAAEWDPD